MQRDQKAPVRVDTGRTIHNVLMSGWSRIRQILLAILLRLLALRRLEVHAPRAVQELVELLSLLLAVRTLDEGDVRAVDVDDERVGASQR